MSYTVCPYLVSIDDLKKVVGSKDRNLTIAVLKKRAEERGETFDESEFDNLVPMEEDDNDDWDEWNTNAAVKAIVDGDVRNKIIERHQYGYALEALCQYLGEREGVEALESIRCVDTVEKCWSWLFSKKKLIPFKNYNSYFPFIGHLSLANIPKEIKRTKNLELDAVREGIDDPVQAKELMDDFLSPIIAQLEMEVAVFSADYETATVSPADFPWLDESYYDSVQQKLESLGFSKVRDGELLHLSKLCPETRYFFRLLINKERNITAAISQIRVVKPENDEQKSIDNRSVEFTSEFADKTFLVTANVLGVTNLENVKGITFCNLTPDTPLSELLDYHKEQTQLRISWTKGLQLRTYATDDEIKSMGKRQQTLMRASRKTKLEAMQKMKASMTEPVANNEPDDDLLEWLEEIRTGLLALYEKAVETKKDIVTFYY